jgi:chemotaxis receptor (MCP) glutamine deamidase CheD
MTDTEVAVKLENHDQQIKSLKHRMDEQEEQGKSLSSLALSVQKLALSMESMIEEQKNQGARLAKLEAEPAERWSNMTRTIFNTVVGAGAGAFATGVIYMMAQYIK